MRKYLSYLLLLAVTATQAIFGNCGTTNPCFDPCKCEQTSKSYLAFRPQFLTASPERVSGFRNDRLHDRECGHQAAFQAVVFGGKSVNPSDLARYYFPFCKESLVVSEQVDDITLATQADINSAHFNVYTRFGNFRSRISIAPKQTTIALGLEWRKSFWRCEDRGRGFWAGVSFPITHIRNDINWTEEILNNGGGADQFADTNVVANMTEAFQQKEWRFGKISPCPLKETRVADIEVKIGYEWLEYCPCHLESYVGVVIPTGNKYNGEFVFEPIVGNGHHFGVIFGSALGVDIWDNQECERSLRMEYAAHSQYLFANTQCRSVDLLNNPWSRYIEVYKNKDQAQAAANLATNGQAALAATLATPGINVLTLPLRVTPGYSVNMNVAGIFTCCNWDLEAGYNFWARRGDCVKLACCFDEVAAIKHPVGLGFTLPIRTITTCRFTENYPNDNDTGCSAGDLTALNQYDRNVITTGDLNLESAATPCMLSNTVYGSFTYNYCVCDYPSFVNGGTSYEFSTSNNAVINRWTVWGKLGFSF